MQLVKRTGAQQFDQRTCQTLSTPPHRADASDPLALGRPAFPLSGGSPAALPPYPQTKDPPHFSFRDAECRTSGSAPIVKAGSDAQGARCRRARCGPLAYWSTLGIAHGAGLVTSPVENAAHHRFRFPLKRGFSSARRPEAMRAVRAFGLREYSRHRGTLGIAERSA